MKTFYFLTLMLATIFCRAQTAEWKLTTEDGVNLYVYEFGKGDTVLVLHGGWGAEHSYLTGAFLPLADSFHFVFYDQRGSLRSQCHDSLVSVAAHIEDVERMRKALGISKLTIAGHSMGGFLAMSYLEKYPSNLKKLLLISSSPAEGTIADLGEKINEPTLKRWDRSIVKETLRKNGLDTFKRKDYTPQQRWLWHRITFAAINLHNVERWEELKGTLFYSQGAGMAAILSSPEKWNFIPAIVSSKIPVLILHGQDDYLPVQYHKNYLAKIPNAIFIEVENSGHCLWVDNPKIFNSSVSDFLKK